MPPRTILYGLALVLSVSLALGLDGCWNAQQAQVATTAFCVLSKDGTVAAVSLTKGAANATAQKLDADQPVACATATVVGQALAKP